MNGSELDFWLGSSRAGWEGGEGTNRIARELDGNVVVERFEGRPSLELRMVFCDIEPDSFRWLWERSTDGGATWATAWEIAYTRMA